IVSGGAALDPALGQSWRELGIEVIQGYGTTECSPGISFNRLGLNRLGSVGTPLPGVEVKIAEDGEVLARGANVFKGYWENEEATRAVLDKDGWYHTGDLGALDAEGFLWLHGRKKDMIVLADGTKVYPEDIENTLAADPRIEAIATPLRPAVATIVGLQRPGEDMQVHGVFLVKDEAQVAAIVRDANTKLSGSQQIRGWTIWPDDDFPTTPTQKVKKRFVVDRLLELQRGDGRVAIAAADGEAHRLSEVEALVAQVAKVSPTVVRPAAQLSADLGMDSLARIDLLGVIEEELGSYIGGTA